MFLQNMRQIKKSTKKLRGMGIKGHSLKCKNWDLYHVLRDLSGRDGSLIDLGCTGSFVLKYVRKWMTGELYGVDLRSPSKKLSGVNYIQSDLLSLNMNKKFDFVTCISVIEHEIQIDKFAVVVDDLLKSGGRLYISFDYWNPKVISKCRPYGLAWNIFCKKEVENLVEILSERNINLIHDVDWSIDQKIINKSTWAPPKSEDDIGYTFGLLTFMKG